MMKRLIQVSHIIDDIARRAIMYMGLAFLVVLFITSYGYLRLGVEPLSIDLALFIEGWQIYIWLVLPVCWGLAKALHYGLLIRNWWVHSESHKIEIRQLVSAIRR